MAASLQNVHRSLREAVAHALGSPPWVVRVADEIPQENIQRPVAYVEISAPGRVLQARAVVPQGAVLRTASFAVTAYPKLGKTPATSAQEADEVAAALDALAGAGVEVAKAPATPLHLAVFNWSAVKLEGTAAERMLPPEAEPLTWANIPVGWAVEPVKDPEDPLRFAVMLELQLEWWDAGVSGPLTPESEGVDGSFKP